MIHAPTSSRGRRLTIAGLVTLGLAAGGAVAADASFASGDSGSSSAPAAPKPRPAAPSKYDLDGTVTAVTTSSLSVRSQFGTARTYAVSKTTTVHADPGTTASVSTLATGQHVHVHGTKSGSTYTATDVDVRAAHIDGAVQSIVGDVVTVTDDDGFTRHIELSSSTTFTKDGAKSTRSALVKGSVVRAEGKVDSDATTLDATRVEIRTKDAPPAGPDGGPKADGRGGPGGHGGPGAGRPGPPNGSGNANKPAAPPSGAASGAPSGGASSGS